MRTRRNITDEELSQLGAVRDWNEDIVKTLTVNSELLWVHNCRKKFTSLNQNDGRLVKRVSILASITMTLKRILETILLKVVKMYMMPVAAYVFVTAMTDFIY